MEIYIIPAVLLLILLIGILTNNRIIAKKNTVSQAYGSIEIYLKKRFDLLPNLAAMLNRYMAHEKELLLQVTKLRSQAEKAGDHKENIEASNQLTKLIGGLSVNMESYPELKADRQFINLQVELSDMEEQISAARRAFNAAVVQYNNQIQMFPANLIASIRKDQQELLLEIPKAEQKEVNLNQLLN
ncbi:LemA family protein [Algoriphagus sp. C2-6-M1]|uniref:LemA family protein n=1 Tax=Algoriphagus persicinus TaxID=3108754 RepID=UPI002B3E970D|nr:LemA family protein [Algoriphagus sp. C2-6-M1]MEB2782453.1 LemA family protein [Algoriphagus sp. C2-6-M1]